MSDEYARIAFSEHVKAAQERYGSRAAIDRWVQQQYSAPTSGPGRELTSFEREFLAERDGFYVATVSDDRVAVRPVPRRAARVRATCPDAQHAHAGPTSAGTGSTSPRGTWTTTHESRCSSWTTRTACRLKIFGTASVVDVRGDAIAAAARCRRATPPGWSATVSIHVEAYDWNCPQHITPRYTAAEVQALTEPLRQRVRDLEAQLSRVRRPAGHGS